MQRKQLRQLFICFQKKKRKRLSQWRTSIHSQVPVFGARINDVSTKGDECWYLLPGWAMTPPLASASPQVAGLPLPEWSSAELGSQPLCASVSRGQCSYKQPTCSRSPPSRRHRPYLVFYIAMCDLIVYPAVMCRV